VPVFLVGGGGIEEPQSQRKELAQAAIHIMSRGLQRLEFGVLCNPQTDAVSNLLFSRSKEVLDEFVARPIMTNRSGRADLNPISRLF